MATTVGATLASSKLAVTQDDLHLIGSFFDQLVVHFDQAAFDKLLAADRVKPNKPRSHRHKAHTTAARLTAAASRSFTSLPPQGRGAACSPRDRAISTPVRPHIYHPAREMEVP